MLNSLPLPNEEGVYYSLILGTLLIAPPFIRLAPSVSHGSSFIL